MRRHHRVLGALERLAPQCALDALKSSSSRLEPCIINVVRKRPPCSLVANFGIDRSVVSNEQGHIPPRGSVAPGRIPRVGRAIVDAPARGGRLSADHTLLSFGSGDWVDRGNSEIPCFEHQRKTDFRKGTDRRFGSVLRKQYLLSHTMSALLAPSPTLSSS